MVLGFAVVALAGALPATVATASGPRVGPIKAPAVRWHRPVDIGCGQSFDAGRYPRLELKVATAADGEGADAYLACARPADEKLLYAEYSPGKGLVDRAELDWPGLMGSAATPCCPDDELAIAHRAGTTYIAYALPGGAIRLSRRKADRWQTDELVPSGEQVSALAMTAGKAGVYLAWSAKSCDEGAAFAGAFPSGSPCGPAATRVLRIDDDRQAVKTVSDPSKGASEPALAMDTQGAYVAFLRDCRDPAACGGLKRVVVKLVTESGIVDRSPPAGLGPALLSHPLLGWAGKDLYLVYTRSHVVKKGRRTVNGQERVVRRTTSYLRFTRYRKGDWSPPRKIDGAAGGAMIPRDGEALIAYGCRKPALARHLGAGFWEYSDVNGAECADSVAAAGKEVFVGSYPRLFAGEFRDRPKLLVSLSPRRAGAYPTLRISLNQKRKGARALSALTVELGQEEHELRAAPEKIGMGDSGHGKALGRLVLEPFSGAALRATLVARDGNIRVGSARRRTRRVSVSLGDHALTIENLPHTSYRRIYVRIDGRRGGLLRNPAQCVSILFVGGLLTARTGANMTVPAVTALKCSEP